MNSSIFCRARPTLCTDEGRTNLSPGICAGFKAGTGNGHHLVNETAEDVLYLEIGDRISGDQGSYPDDDLQTALVEGKWQFTQGWNAVLIRQSLRATSPLRKTASCIMLVRQLRGWDVKLFNGGWGK
jgi:hypothetical protein